MVEARRQRVAELLREHRYLGVDDVARHTGVSQNTARRDLAVLAEREEVTRTFGGAVAAYDRGFASFGDRLRKNVQAKRLIASAAAKLVEAGMHVYLDAGSTIALVAEVLATAPPRSLLVTTHSIAVAERCGRAGVEVRVLGGRWLPNQACVLDERTVDEAGSFEYDLALLGAEAIDVRGASNTDETVVALQRRVRLLARRCVLCVDAEKLGGEAAVRLAGWDEIDTLCTNATTLMLRRVGIDLPAAKLQLAR